MITSGEALTPRRGRIWYVDDTKLEIERATRVLAPTYDIETFSEGALMLERLGVGRLPDVVLLDWQMPVLSGIELCRFLRGQYDEVTLPILMLTGRGEREDFAEGLEAGANDYVAKPYDDAELRARVRTLVRVHRQAEETRERELWLRTTLSSIGEGVIATDGEGRILFMNPVAEALTGVMQHDALARPFTDVCRFVEDTRTAAGVRAAGMPGPAASVIVRRDGTTIAIEHNVSPIVAGDVVVGSVYVLRDVTGRRLREAEVRARADFEEKLIGIVSHDLRNPLQAILLGTMALLGQEDIDARTTKSVLRIQRSADRATRLVSDVLDFTQARLGNGIPMHRQQTNMHELAAQVVDEVLAAHPQREILVESSGQGSGSWDSERIAQVITNLVSNALKYGTQGRPVKLRTRGEPTDVIIEVHNEGEAISAELVPQMFEPMKRGLGSTDSQTRSVGLGLYIVKHIIDTHRGVIEVRSTSTEGTTFLIRLPRG